MIAFLWAYRGPIAGVLLAVGLWGHGWWTGHSRAVAACAAEMQEREQAVKDQAAAAAAFARTEDQRREAAEIKAREARTEAEKAYAVELALAGNDCPLTQRDVDSLCRISGHCAARRP